MNQNETPEPARYERHIGLAVLVMLLIGCFVIIQPFFSALLWAIVLSFSIWPVHRKLVTWLKGRRSLAALLISLTFAAALVVPLTVAVANFSDDASALVTATRNWIDAGVPPAPAWVGKIPLVGSRVANYWNDLGDEVSSALKRVRPTTDPAPTTQSEGQSKLVQTLRTILDWTKTWLLSFSLAIGSGVMQITISLLLIFFILRDGETLAERVNAMAVRVFGDEGMRLLEVAGGTMRGVIYGILGTALAQGLMAGIGFLIAGVPGATLLGLITFFVSVLPMGPPLIWIPASIWLFHQGSPAWGIFMLIWGVGVSSIDNVVKPWIISRGSKMPFVLIFFGVLGGALAFGLIGVFIGPTLLAVAYRVIDEWSKIRTASART